MSPTDYARLLEIKAYMSKFRGELALMSTGNAIATNYIEAAADNLSDSIFLIGKADEAVKVLNQVKSII